FIITPPLVWIFIIFCIIHPSIHIISYYTPVSYNKAMILCKRFVSKQKVFFYKCIKDLFIPIMKACLPIYIQYPKQLLNNHLWEIQIEEFYLACSVHWNLMFFLLCENIYASIILL